MKPRIIQGAEYTWTIYGLYADQSYEVEAAAPGYAPLDPGGEVITKNFRMKLDSSGETELLEITLEPERDYAIPALFRNTGWGQWEIGDLRLGDIRPVGMK